MTERPNKELALRYYSDITMAAWHWDETNARWVPTTPNPCFSDGRHWHVGHEAPTEPPVKTCELAGIRFPMPMTEAPAKGTRYWTPITDIETWSDHEVDREWLEMGFCQATREGAIAQGRAMAAVLKQAIEGAK